MLKNWTLCVLTIPIRDENIRKLLSSLNEEKEQGLNVKIVYNCPKNTETKNLSDRLSTDFKGIETIFYDSQYYGLSEGRNKLLKETKTPLIAFVDDDCSFEGKDIFSNLEKTLKNTSVALLGLPSFKGSSSELIKPRKDVPQCEINGLIYTYIEGMFCAGYTELLKNIKGFNKRLIFWGEWIDLNTKLHRAGFPTAMKMNSGFLRHWEGPDSPTRDKKGRVSHVLYGLLEFSRTFDHDLLKQPKGPLQLIERKYFESYKDQAISEGILTDITKVIQRILDNEKDIAEYRKYLDSLQFNFPPLGVREREDWLKLIEYSENQIMMYKEKVF